MKEKERELACVLRRKGLSLGKIATKIHCSKGSVSVWTRGILLTKIQIENLHKEQNKGRAKAANHPNSPKAKWQNIRSGIERKASTEIPLKFTSESLRMVCAALYWGEGYKKGNALFVLANSDPDMIKLMMKFLTNTCKVPLQKIRGRVNIFPHADLKKIEEHWSTVSGIPVDQFHKPLLAVSRSSLQRRKTLPYGTFRIIISNVIICSQFRGWIKRLKTWASSSTG